MTESACVDTVVEVTSPAVTPPSVSTGANPVPRRRFQKGSLAVKSGRRYGVFRVDILQPNGTFARKLRWEPLGLVTEQSERAAWKQFQPFLDATNEAARSAPRIGLTLSEFVEEWRRDVSVNLKVGTVRVAESNLRAHIIPRLGELHLTEINTKVVQGFVAYLSGCGRSRKTNLNVLATLSSIMRTAKSWGYACGDFHFADLTLPREGVKKEQRAFTDDEVHRMIAAAPEPFATILAITAVHHLDWLGRKDSNLHRPH